jgi:hypothetical protein
MKTLLLFIALAAMAAPALAQEAQDQAPAAAESAPEPPTLAQTPDIKPVPAGAPGSIPKGAKPVKRETKDKIQDLLVEQANDVAAALNNEVAYLRAKEKLEADKVDVAARLQAAADDGAREQKIDPARFRLDLQKWLWIPKEK